MARPIKTGAEWFSHSVHAFSDSKIEMLRIKHKNDGYAFYFFMLEQIYQKDNYELDLSDENAEDIIILFASKLMISIDTFNSILETCLKYGLFDKEVYKQRKCITSNGIKKRSSVFEHTREYDRKRKSLNKSNKNYFPPENSEFKKENNNFPEENENFPSHTIQYNNIQYDTIEKQTNNNTETDSLNSVCSDDVAVCCFQEGMSPETPRRLATLSDLPEITGNWYILRVLLNNGIKTDKIIEIYNKLSIVEIARLWFWAKIKATKNPAGYFLKLYEEDPDEIPDELDRDIIKQLKELSEREPIVNEKQWRIFNKNKTKGRQDECS